jgi:hypothetical protein
MEYTALGMPLVGLPESGNYTVHPLSAIVVMKGMDSDGDEVYAVLMTENMSPLEGVALARYADIYATVKIEEMLASPGQP